jgi:hypothetical protein
MLERAFQSGEITLLLLAVMLVEALVFMRVIKRMPGLLMGLGAGAAMVLALRAALLQQHWSTIALFLTLSFGFHILEIRQWLRLAKQQPQ